MRDTSLKAKCYITAEGSSMCNQWYHMSGQFRSELQYSMDIQWYSYRWCFISEIRRSSPFPCRFNYEPSSPLGFVYGECRMPWHWDIMESLPCSTRWDTSYPILFPQSQVTSQKHEINRFLMPWLIQIRKLTISPSWSISWSHFLHPILNQIVYGTLP